MMNEMRNSMKYHSVSSNTMHDPLLRSLANIALYKQTHMCPGARLIEFNQIGRFVIVSYDVPYK